MNLKIGDSLQLANSTYLHIDLHDELLLLLVSLTEEVLLLVLDLGLEDLGTLLDLLVEHLRLERFEMIGK